jgi:acyl-coenzyme A synthetase/AMP-(fatty) acid ligase
MSVDVHDDNTAALPLMSLLPEPALSPLAARVVVNSLNTADGLLAATLSPHGRMRPALWFQGRTITHAALHAQVNRATHALATLGVQPGSSVLLLLEDAPIYITLLLACAKAGAVAVPLSLTATADDCARIAVEMHATLLVTQSSLAAASIGMPPSCITIQTDAAPSGFAEPLATMLATQSSHAGTTLTDADDPLFRFVARAAGSAPHTQTLALAPSGLSHRAVSQRIAALRESGHFDETTVMLSTLKLASHTALDAALFGTLAHGGCVVLSPETVDLWRIAQCVTTTRPTLFVADAPLLERLLQWDDNALAPFRTVKQCICVPVADGHGDGSRDDAAGKAAADALVAAWMARLGGVPVVA